MKVTTTTKGRPDCMACSDAGPCDVHNWTICEPCTNPAALAQGTEEKRRASHQRPGKCERCGLWYRYLQRHLVRGVAAMWSGAWMCRRCFFDVD